MDLSPRSAAARLSLTALVVALTLSLLALVPAPAVAQTDEPQADHHVLIFTKTTQFRHTEAITQGTPVLEAAFAEVGISSEHTEDSTIFNDEDLARFDALVMFQTSGDPWTADEKAALERYQQAGGGIVAIHNATDMRGNYAWWDELVGALMPAHAATGTSPGLPGTVRVEDQTHASTEHLPQRWQRADEWYNFSNNVRGTAHVLATMDESTYNAGSSAMGYDHPISWCKPYDGGRAWVTGMGHFGAHYTDEPDFVQHIVGGVQWAAGQVESDCGGTIWDSFEKVPLDQNTSAPFGLDVAPDGRVFFTELVRGQVRIFDPASFSTSTALTLPVYSGGEDGMLDIALAPDFEETGHLYVYYSPASDDDRDPANFWNRVSRFTVEPGDVIDPASEAVIIEIPARRLPDEPGHTGGGLGFDPDGNLLLSVGDDVNPHSEPSPRSAPLSTIPGTFHDARETSSNTADLRGKLLRITPSSEGGYTVPDDNMFNSGTFDHLFPDGVYDPDLALPEIYAMGFRNPFRFAVDPVTGAIGMADYGPDCNSANECGQYGPTGTVTWSLIEEPGNYGWPMCRGLDQAYRDVDYTTSPRTFGELFDCAAPVNDSPRNTGLTDLPPVVQPDLRYGYQSSTVPQVLTPGGALGPMGGPFYDYDPDLESETKFPSSYDGKAMFYEWARNRVFSMTLDRDAGPGDAIEKVDPFLPPPNQQWLAPIDMKYGADGSLYVLEWGGGFARHNPNSGLYRVDYVAGGRSPIAAASADPDSGHAPLEVAFSSEGSSDPEGGSLTYAWDFENDGVTDSTAANPTWTYTSDGVHEARLTVTSENGKTGVAVVSVTVGNTRPDVRFAWPPDGGFFEFGDEISWDLQIDDAEDDEILDAEVIVQPALGHDEHAHPGAPYTGRTGTVQTSLGGHSADGNVFFVLDGRYTDQGTDTAPPLDGSDTIVLQPKRKQAEHHTASEGTTTAASGDVESGEEAISGQGGAWAAYDPINLTNIDSLTLRVASATGGDIELRRDAPDGPLLGTAEVAATGGPSRYRDVTVELDDPGETFTLYLVFPGDGARRVNFIEADGKGVSPTTRPQVRITAPDGGEQLELGEIEVTADASDAEHEVTQVQFLVDGDSIGVDSTAPYAVTWEPTEERLYELTAVATNDAGRSTTSRIVVAQVGELFGDFESFTNTQAEFERLGANRWAITANGANMWQATDQYGSLFLPAGAGTQWTATVKVESQQNTHNSAKAGLIVRNDVTQPASSPGYAAMTMRAGNAYEWLRDTSGNGQLNASTNAGSNMHPAWVRITRDGDTYTGYWSADGVNFTATSSEVLPGAADVQDIGMVVTAHSTSMSRAVFSDFELEIGPPGGDPDPDPDPDHPGPVCAAIGSDEFDGEALDTGRWTTVRTADEAQVRVVEGSLVLPVTQGDIDGASAGPISYVGQPARDGAWEVTTQLDLPHTREWQHGGLMLHATDDEYVKLAFTRHSSGHRFLEFQTETAGSRTWHASQNLPADFPSTIQLRLTSDGEQLTAAYSTDGEDWTALSGAAPVKDDATIGMVAAGDTGAAEVDASFSWFRIDPDGDDDGQRSVSDTFEGDELDGCRWNAVVRYDPNTVRLQDGSLEIDTRPGDINGTDNTDPRNFILQDVPEGDWTIETELTTPMLHQWQLAGLIAYGDDDNYVKLDVVANNAPGSTTNLRAELVSERNAQFGGGGNRNIDIANATESGTRHLRLSRTGSTYEGWVSDDGHEWISLGAPVTNDADLHSFGLMAIGPDQQTPVTVAFRRFTLVGEDGDPGPTDPPVVSATLDPGEPDGEDGWYVSPVTVTLSADDEEAALEYRTDDGDWAAYTAPVTVADDGEWTVEYRGTNTAGTSDVASVSFRIDGTAPETEARIEGSQLPNGRYLGPVEVELTAQDATSGVATTEYRVDGGAWATYTEPIVVDSSGGRPSQRTVEFRSVDAAGNVEQTRRVRFTSQGPGG